MNERGGSKCEPPLFFFAYIIKIVSNKNVIIQRREM